MSDDHTCAIDDAGYCDTCGKLMWPRPVSEPEITDEMVDLVEASLEMTDFLDTDHWCTQDEIKEVRGEGGWCPLTARNVALRQAAMRVTAALPHSPLLAENKVLKERLAEAYAHDEAVTTTTSGALRLCCEEIQALKEDRRHWEKMACHWWDSVRVLKEENEKLRREMRSAVTKFYHAILDWTGVEQDPPSAVLEASWAIQRLTDPDRSAPTQGENSD